MSATLAEQALAGQRRALARLLTLVENRAPGAEEALAVMYPHSGRATVLGVTGAPGTGKSTLVSALAKAYRAQGRSVAILAVDPTSPFTGGAILGDRIRMKDLSGDSGVFIRSMATRGNLGGLARATRDAARVLDAAGFDVVMIETVGAGQNEVDIARAAQTTLVVEAPGLGDDVQAIKAGILEVADVLVVNKADRPGAAHTVRGLRAMLELGHPPDRATVRHHGQTMRLAPTAAPAPDAPLWVPPIIQTVAQDGEGVDGLLEAIAAHQQHLRTANGQAAQAQHQVATELLDRLRDALMDDLLATLPPDLLQAAVDSVAARQHDPQTAARQLLAAWRQHMHHR